MAPGPASSGIASGKTLMSCRVAASSFSRTVVERKPESLASTMSMARKNSKMPPAILKAGSPMPSVASSQSPGEGKNQQDNHRDKRAFERHLAAVSVAFGCRQRCKNSRHANRVDNDEQRDKSA